MMEQASPTPSDSVATASKSILLFSDGTGNSSAKLFKTNVWRLYRAVDLDERPASGARQIAAYDDGVGTSAFLPLRLVGGAFGVGLRRNVLDLYRFACRNYAPGDRIYAFGFSRGAFTIRVLIGLIAEMGLVQAKDEAELVALSESAYREYRRCFRLAGDRPLREGASFGKPSGGSGSGKRDLTWFLVRPLRRLRDRIRPLPSIEERCLEVPSIAFVGVWDTVAAYGTPAAEVTRGIDRWVWPLSMPNYTLSPKVEAARHALALDDERDTFHPLLWDEVEEAKFVKADPSRAGRLRQVWFPGMHADVGGGYPDDSLAHVPLVWMIDEAKAVGLRLKAGDEAALRAAADPFGPIHDSRAGLASYYRYQPRKLAARLQRPDPTTRAQQDPELGGEGLLTEVVVHDSVVRRLEAGTDAYAPIVLPASYSVDGGAPVERLPAARAAAQERVWDSVWHRRANFFSSVFATLALAALPLAEKLWPAGACLGPQCVAAPLVRSLDAVLPDLLNIWLRSFAARPGTFIILVSIIFALRVRSQGLEGALRVRMWEFLVRSMRDAPADRTVLDAAAKGGRGTWRLRSSPGYQGGLQALKWRVVPAMVGPALLLSLIAAAVAAASLAAAAGHRVHLAAAERFQWHCRGADEPLPDAPFATDRPCWIAPARVTAGRRYQLRMRVQRPWSDGGIAASPAGFANSELPFPHRLVAPLLRRSMNDPWFRPLVAVEGRGTALGGVRAVAMRRADCDCGLYVGEFVAPASGRPVLAVNDAVRLWGGRPDDFYVRGRGANAGTAQVEVAECGVDAECR